MNKYITVVAVWTLLTVSSVAIASGFASAESDVNTLYAQSMCMQSHGVTSGILEEACGRALDKVNGEFVCDSYAPSASVTVKDSAVCKIEVR